MGAIAGRSLPLTWKALSDRTRRQIWRNLAGYFFISPWLVGFFVLTAIPVLASLGLSFTDYHVLSRRVNWVGLGNFQTMLTGDPRYWRSVKATLYYTFVSVPFRLIAALAIAMLLNQGRRLLSVYRALYYAPSVVGGSVAVAVMWREIFGSNGLLNSLLAVVGLGGMLWLGDPRTAIWTLILLAVWQFGSPMLVFLAGLKQVPVELYEAASIDGAGRWQRFAEITLPLLTPVIFFNLVMQTIFSFMVFTQAFIVTGGAPLDTTLFYSLYIYIVSFRYFRMGYGSAMAWVLLFIVAIFTTILFRSSRYWVHYEVR